MAAHPIEQVGAKLRDMMPWIKKNKLVDQTKNCRGGATWFAPFVFVPNDGQDFSCRCGLEYWLEQGVGLSIDMPDIPPRKSLMNPELRRRGIYVLPNLLTTAALFAGFYAIVQAMTGRFEHAAVAIFVAMVFDGLDGRVARMTRTQSAFGAEYDSLSDMVSFGAAPALDRLRMGDEGNGQMGLDCGFRVLRWRRAAAGPLQYQYRHR
jgi:hypothetical protein